MSAPEIVITHTHAEGTLIEGTSRGDGTAEILKPCGWRYSRQVGWYVPRSRDRDADAEFLARTLEKLRSAGYLVSVTTDNTSRRTADVERDRENRRARRADRLRARADRQQQNATSAGTTASALSEGWPLGQPIISDAARRHQQRMVRADARERHELEQAEAAEVAARAAEASLGAREAPQVVAGRIDRLGATQRRLERSLAGYTSTLDGIQHPPLEGRAKERAEVNLARTLEQLEHWQQVRRHQISSGQVTEYGPENVRAGDHVLVNDRWYLVLRANTKTVSLQWWVGNAPSRGTTPWAKVHGHRPVSG